MDKKRILIIDDEVYLTKLVKLNLEKTGQYEVRVENKGSNGLVATKVFKPDLVLLDIVMPDMEGSNVAIQIRNDEKTKNIPIVFLTAVVTKEEADFGGSTIGGSSFIAKPVSVEELTNCIEKNIRK